MARAKVTSGMWRVDPLKWSRVVDRCGAPIASAEGDAEANSNASLIAAAPDMFAILESLENSVIPEDVLEDIRMVLRRARGELGLAVFSRGANRLLRARTKEWLKFMDGLWKPDRDERR